MRITLALPSAIRGNAPLADVLPSLGGSPRARACLGAMATILVEAVAVDEQQEFFSNFISRGSVQVKNRQGGDIVTLDLEIPPAFLAEADHYVEIGDEAYEWLLHKGEETGGLIAAVAFIALTDILAEQIQGPAQQKRLADLMAEHGLDLPS